MGIAKKTAKRGAQYKAVDAATTARPYVQRLVEDEQLRDDIKDAFDAARNAFDRAAGKGSPIDALEDDKLHRELRNAAESLRSATDTLKEPERKKSSGPGFGTLLLIAILGAVLALVLSEDLRKAVLDAVFGAEEEFEYSSTSTGSDSQASTGAASSSSA